MHSVGARKVNGAVAVRGQSLPEFLIAIPIFMFMVLMVFQLALVYRAKSLLDYATFEAARVGAVTGADLAAMERAFAKAMTPLYASSTGAGGVLDGWRKARVDLLLHSSIEIVSPTATAMEDFRERQYDGRYALPNDNLSYRDSTVGGSGMSVQDANILKIRVDYNYRLLVPFVDRVLRGDSRFIPRSGLFDPGVVDLARDHVVFGDRNRMPLQSYAVVRMQSPIYEEGASLPDGS
jgi:hypothetical protein